MVPHERTPRLCARIGVPWRDNMNRLTVRGETPIPSFRRNSAAIRSSPHVLFAAAIVSISFCRFPGIGGLPGARDLQRQKTGIPFGCQPISVCGLTTVSSCRHSRNRDNATSVIRVALSARRGFACRSTYNANCFRSNRFSAAS